MNALILRLLEQLQKKVDLQQRLTAGYRNAAVLSPIGPVPQRLAEHLVRRSAGTAPFVPGVRIVAEPATHAAALHEHHKPDARSVHGAEGFRGMNSSHHCHFRAAISFLLPRSVRYSFLRHSFSSDTLKITDFREMFLDYSQGTSPHSSSNYPGFTFEMNVIVAAIWEMNMIGKINRAGQMKPVLPNTMNPQSSRAPHSMMCGRQKRRLL